MIEHTNESKQNKTITEHTHELISHYVAYLIVLPDQILLFHLNLATWSFLKKKKGNLVLTTVIHFLFITVYTLCLMLFKIQFDLIGGL